MSISKHLTADTVCYLAPFIYFPPALYPDKVSGDNEQFRSVAKI